MIGKTGLQFTALHMMHLAGTAKEIAEAYKVSSDAMVQAIKEQWTDDTLLEEKDMYGETWSCL